MRDLPTPLLVLRRHSHHPKLPLLLFVPIQPSMARAPQLRIKHLPRNVEELGRGDLVVDEVASIHPHPRVVQALEAGGSLDAVNSCIFVFDPRTIPTFLNAGSFEICGKKPALSIDSIESTHSDLSYLRFIVCSSLPIPPDFLDANDLFAIDQYPTA